MLLSILQVESRVDRPANPDNYTPIPQDNDIEQNSIETNLSDQFCGNPWRIVRSTVGFMALLMFCIMLPRAYYSYPRVSNPFPPRFFLNSLRVSTFNISESELSATWNANLTIFNGVNSTLINIVNFNALMMYKEDKALAQNDPIKSDNVDSHGIFVIYKNENKTLHLTFNTTGWEGDQPIVDDDVIQEIGAVSFGLKMIVEADINYNLMNIPIAMQPYCSDLEVDLAPLERGEVATLDDIGEARECSGPVEWYMNKYR